MVTKQQFTKANQKRKELLAQREGVTVEFLRDFFKKNDEFKGKTEQLLEDVINLATPTVPTIHIVNIVDISSSMSGSKIDAANEMIDSDIKKVNTEKDVNYTYTLRTFSSRVDDYLFKLNNNPRYKKLYANGMTALYDAIGMTLNDLITIPENEKVIVSIITDGEENSSKHYNAKEVSKLIEELNSKNFTITFVGTERDVEKSINLLKIDKSNTLSYNGTGAGLKQSMRTRSTSLDTYSKNVIAGKDVKKGFYKQVNK